MSTVSQRLVCPSRNAFRPRQAIWQFLLELRASHVPQRRKLTSSLHRRREAGVQVLDDEAGANAAQSHLGPGHGASALDSLQSSSNQTASRGSHESVASQEPSQNDRDNLFLDQIDPTRLAKTIEAHGAASRGPFRYTRTSQPPQSSSPHKVEGGRVIGLLPHDKIHHDFRYGFAHLTFNEGHTAEPQRGRKLVAGTNALEYQALSVRPPAFLNIRDTKFPWSSWDSKVSGFARVSQEIRDFHNFMMPNALEKIAREAVIADVQSIIAREFPRRMSEVIGSERTGLSTALSDIDFRLAASTDELVQQGTSKVKAPRHWMRQGLENDLKKLVKVFRLNPDYVAVHFRHARYPLVTARHKKSDIDIQIVLANDSVLARSYIERYLAEIPALRPLYTFMKTTFDIRGLSDVYRGGLGSYSLFMLLVAVLKQDKLLQRDDVASQLLHFLSYFSHLDTYKVGLSVEPPTTFMKTSASGLPKTAPRRSSEIDEGSLTQDTLRKLELDDSIKQLATINPIQPYLLVLQDPADPYNDLGRKHYSIKHSQKTLLELDRSLKRAVTENPPGTLLMRFVGCAYVMFFEKRKKLRKWGNKCLSQEGEEGGSNLEQDGDDRVASA